MIRPRPPRSAVLVALALSVLLAPAGAAAQSRAAPEAATGYAAKPVATAERWMIVAAHPLAAEAGAGVLRAGGAAVDAAIAAQLALNVVEPQSSGLGGGGFALHWSAADRSLTSWDGRETAPFGAGPDLFLGPDGAPIGWLQAVESGRSVGAPGLLRMLEALHADHGALPWAALAAPAIRLAEEGFPVSPRLAASTARFEDRLKRSQAADVFFGAGGAPLAAGALFRQPRLGATLREIAEKGADIFYEGRIAEDIAQAVAAEPAPGALNRADLAAYQPVRRPPVCLVYRQRFEVCGMGPPSSGGVTVAQMLGLLDHAPIPAMAPESPTAWRLFAEASRLAYADRDAYLADPDQVSVPTAGLLTPAYLTLRAQALGRTDPAAGPADPGMPPWREGALNRAPDESAERPGTTHLTVVDARGNIVSLTSSIETAFGSGRMAAGFLLNNQLTDFSFAPERGGRPIANAPGPGKRPRSSMAPVIVFDISGGDRRPVLALGSPGGSRIIEYVAAALIRRLDWGLPVDQAAAGVHVSQRNRGAVVVEDAPAGDPIAEALAAAGHSVERRALTSGLHLIAIGESGALTGGADPRREGIAIGE